MFLKIFAVSIFILLLGTKTANSEPAIIEAPPTVISINHLCFPTGSVLSTWRKNGERTECSFPYGLSREDVQIAIYEGP